MTSEAVNYELLILSRMIDQLPPKVGELIHAQTTKVMDAVTARFQEFSNALRPQVEDTLLLVKMLEFDLEATKRERDSYKKRLSGLS